MLMDARARHADIEGFPALDGCLQVGGIALSRLARRVGRTPFYAVDRALVSARLQALRCHLPERIQISYAIKANPMPALVQHLAGLVDGFDVASSGELKLALDTPIPPAAISFAGPGKSREAVSQGLFAGVLFNVESESELAMVAELGQEAGIRPRVAVRINPDFDLRHSGFRMGGGARQFGIDAERVSAVLRAGGGRDLAFEGFHIFSGSQNLSVEDLRESQARTIELARRLAQDAPGPVRVLNIGGGFGIPYFPGQRPLDLAAVGAGLAELMPEIEAAFPGTRVVLELGRFLVGEAGIYVCRVLDRKVSRGSVFLVTDGGLHHHHTATGNWGQIFRKNYPVALGNRLSGADSETVTVVGCLCTPLDLLAENVTLPKAQVGDLIVIFRSGAYGRTASPTGFLSHTPPAEVLV